MSKFKPTDREIVDGVIRGDERITHYLFYELGAPIFAYVAASVFSGRVDRNELVSELYLYIIADDFARLKNFSFKSSLKTWLSVVAVRFFQKKRAQLIESDSSEVLLEQMSDTIVEEENNEGAVQALREALSRMENERYRAVVQALDLDGRPVAEVAEEFGVNPANLYNIRRRAHLRLRVLMADIEY